MKRKRRRTKKHWIILISILFIFITIPNVYAFYFTKYESTIISKFIINKNLSDSYVRAALLTYWVDITSCEKENDLTTCAINGKSAWNIKTDAINSDWILLEDGYYYYKESVNANEINESNIKTNSIALINSELTLNELTDDHLAGTNIVPQYEIIYEFIEKDSIETAWKVNYENGIPTIVLES